MGEQWIADAALTLTPLWANLIDNGAMIQFVHRWLGLAVAVSALMVCVTALKWGASTRFMQAAGLCVGLVAVQFLLGVTTLVLVVPLNWALSHQVFACFLVMGLVYLNYLVRPQKA
jgi:cytochrome c oxidase assembly protein subunit 15